MKGLHRERTGTGEMRRKRSFGRAHRQGGHRLSAGLLAAHPDRCVEARNRTPPGEECRGGWRRSSGSSPRARPRDSRCGKCVVYLVCAFVQNRLPTAGGKMLRVKALDHVGLIVADLDRSLRAEESRIGSRHTVTSLRRRQLLRWHHSATIPALSSTKSSGC